MTNPDSAPITPHSFSAPFFVTGGTLPLDAASYVARAADEELYQCLRRGEFCYVLNTRQMGKSSLMIRAAQRLREDGKQVVVLDLTGAGQNLSVEQWYFGLLDLVAQQTQREDALFAFWKTHRGLGPMQRFVAALQRVLPMPQEQTTVGGARELIIFIDEIDAVRSLTFSADEFFAGIRECCNRNAQEPTGRRLVFCLLGVATPSDLIRDTRVTPFNIGQRIELRDFTREEAAPLAAGLQIHRGPLEAAALLDRVLYWTGGHPYMTQRLCRAIVESLAEVGQSGNGAGRRRDEIEDAVLVDTLCRNLFLTKSARETDDNLAFVRTRLLHNEEDRAALLDLYGQVRRGKRVKDDETNPLCPVLRLSGVVKAENSWLVLRNEIYSHVFDAAWITEHMPDAEVRRQKRAFQRGVFRAASVFGSLSILSGTLIFAVLNARRAHTAEAYALLQERTASHLLYDAKMIQIQREWDRGYISDASNLLAETRSSQSRNFEWSYWYRLQNEYAPPLALPPQRYILIAPDNRTVGAIAHDDQSPEKGQFISIDIFTGISRFSTPARCLDGQMLAYARDGSRVALCVGKTVEIRDAWNGRLLQTVPAHQEDVLSFEFTADGAAILVARQGGQLSLWDCHAAKTLWNRNTRADRNVVISTNLNHVATMTWEGVLQIWDARTGSELYRNNHDFARGPLSFSPDGRLFVGQSRGSGVEILDLSTRSTRNLPENFGGIGSFQFSAKGDQLVVGFTNCICEYAMPSGSRLNDPDKSTVAFHNTLIAPNGHFALLSDSGGKYHFIHVPLLSASLRLLQPSLPPAVPESQIYRDSLWRVRYSPDGGQLAGACMDGNVYLWDTGKGKLLQTLQGDGVEVYVAAFSHDGSHLAVGDRNGRISLWDTRSGQRLVQFRAHITLDTSIPNQEGGVRDLCFTSDDRQIISAGDDCTAKIWDLTAGVKTAPRLHFTLQGHVKAVTCIALSPGGATLLTGSDDGMAKLWEYRTGRLLHTFKSPAEIWGATFSPDGTQIALANLRKTVEVWNVDSKQKIHSLIGHLEWVTGVAFSPDGERIVSSSRDNTAILWDAQTGQELLTLRGHIGQVDSVAFAPNGRQIATAGSDGIARLWNTDTNTLDTAATNP